MQEGDAEERHIGFKFALELLGSIMCFQIVNDLADYNEL